VLRALAWSCCHVAGVLTAVLCCAQVLEALLGDGFAGVSWGLKQSHLPLKAEAAANSFHETRSYCHRLVQVTPKRDPDPLHTH
jgi:hypothetical protein